MSKKKPLNNYARYSGMGIQMAVIISLGMFGGMKLDELVGIKFPIFTIVLSLAAVAMAIYVSIKDFLK
ncbi:MAG: AtpZ/AtpI family protein [Bacteroidota bacterium]